MDKLDRPEARQEPEAPGEYRHLCCNGDHYSGDSCQFTQMKKTCSNSKEKDLNGTAKSRTVHACLNSSKMGLCGWCTYLHKQGEERF